MRSSRLCENTVALLRTSRSSRPDVVGLVAYSGQQAAGSLAFLSCSSHYARDSLSQHHIEGSPSLRRNEHQLSAVTVFYDTTRQ
jgi:hypothetical protein